MKEGYLQNWPAQKPQAGRHEAIVRLTMQDECLYSGKKVLSSNFKERGDAESFEIKCHM